MTGRAEGIPIKQTIGSRKKLSGGVCDHCKEAHDVTLYKTDKGLLNLCDECNDADDRRRYVRV